MDTEIIIIRNGLKDTISGEEGNPIKMPGMFTIYFKRPDKSGGIYNVLPKQVDTITKRLELGAHYPEALDGMANVLYANEAEILQSGWDLNDSWPSTIRRETADSHDIT